MRRLLTLLITGVVLAAATACGSDPEPPPAGPTAPPITGSPAPGSPPPATAPTTPGDPPPATGSAAPGSPPPATVPPPGPGELPGGLPHGGRRLTGVVERSGDCTTLRVGERRWGLAGARAGGLTAGDRVTVEGQVTTPDPACAVPEVAQAIVVRRVTPA